jgi:hypothetical protein
MFTRIARKLVIGATLAAMVAPAALAEVTGTDPEPRPGVVHTILAFLGIA